MKILANDEKIRYTGRWRVEEHEAVSTANGNYFEFSFKGETAVIWFKINDCKPPFPHLYISVDNGAKIEVTLDRYTRILTEDGIHTVTVIMKGSVETQHRWFAPLESRVSLEAIEADEFVDLEEDSRKLIEFIGDSITEGISIDVGYENFNSGSDDMVYWDDSTAGYAWLTAKALNMRPIIMGYGSLGLTRKGSGNIPKAEESYPNYSDGYPMESKNADFIVINHGTNDWGATREDFKKAYYSFLKLVRERNQNSNIIALTPFSWKSGDDIKEAVDKYNNDFNDNVFYIATAGWISPEPIHPLRDGHKTVSKNLSKIIKEKYSL